MAALLFLSAVALSLSQSCEVEAFSSYVAGGGTHHQRRTSLLFAKKKKKATSIAGKGFGTGNSRTTLRKEQPSTPPLIAHTESSTHATLIQWLQEHDTTYISPKFTIKQSKLGGYGGFCSTTSGFADGELIFRIPRECCVTQDDALNDTSCGEIFQMAKIKRVPSYQMLLLSGFIAKEYLLSKRIKDKTSVKHWSYLQSIPWIKNQLGQDHVIFWSQEEVDILLGESLAYNDALMIRKTVDSAITLMKDVIHPIVQDADDEEIEEAVKGAFVICLSRSFAEEVESDDGTTVEIENALLPLLDVLQHSNSPNTSLESYDDYILLRARGDISADKELFHCYQEERDDVIPKHKFFTRYGFIPGVRTPVVELLENKSSLFF
eukprot:scaffold3356_cov154-Skeletonema_menzelii.AAC.4